MCVLTGIITALGTIGTAITGAVGGSVVGGTVAGATIAGTVGAATGISAGAAVGIGAAATALGVGAIGAGALGLSKAMSNKNSGNLSINCAKVYFFVKYCNFSSVDSILIFSCRLK